MGIQQSAFAQDNAGIHFTDSSWQTLLAKAKAEHKLIFMDAHTTWCGPCKWMDKNVFPDAEVAAIYNHNFINAYTDMEKGEGIDLRKKYEVRAYPTYLFINGDGEVVHKAVGQSTIPEFIQFGLDALSPTHNLQYFEKNYAANSTDFDFVSNYLHTLRFAYENDAANKIALQYLQNQKPELLKERGNWQMLQKYITDASSPVFQYLVNHRSEFEKLFDKKEVEQKIYSTYLAWPQHYLHYSETRPVVFDNKGFDHFLSLLEKSDYEKKAEVIAKSKLTVFFGQGKWEAYTHTVSQMIKDHIVQLDAAGAEDLSIYSNLVYRFAKNDRPALLDATRFAKIISHDVPGISDRNKAKYLELYANLLEETNQKDLATSVRKTIDQQKLNEAHSSSAFQQLQMAPPKKK
jgi:thiol-disulfide isomerase/thioredoxin